MTTGTVDLFKNKKQIRKRNKLGKAGSRLSQWDSRGIRHGTGRNHHVAGRHIIHWNSKLLRYFSAPVARICFGTG